MKRCLIVSAHLEPAGFQLSQASDMGKEAGVTRVRSCSESWVRLDAAGCGCSSGFIRTGRHLHVKERPISTEGFFQWKTCFQFSPDWLWQDLLNTAVQSAKPRGGDTRLMLRSKKMKFVCLNVMDR